MKGVGQRPEIGRRAPGSKPAKEQIWRERGFTMVEIAIAIAVIGFALVAILAVLPSALQVQRDNREDTIINQDGAYWMEAIRSGAHQSVDLSDFVYWVDNPSQSNLSTLEIVGRLSDTNNRPHQARVRAMTSPALERDPTVLGFEYFLFSDVREFPANPNLYEVRLTLRWPWRHNGTPEGTNGTGRKVFRTVVSGRLIETNGFYVLQPKHFGPP